MDTTEVIKEVAAKHGVILTKDDPVLMLLTINEMILANAEKEQKRQFAEFRSELENIALTWGTDTTKKAERIINGALTASTSALNEALSNAMRNESASITKLIDSKINEIRTLRNQTFMILAATVIFAIMFLMFKR